MAKMCEDWVNACDICPIKCFTDGPLSVLLVGWNYYAKDGTVATI